MTELLAARVLAVPDHPQPGIVFRDVTPLLADAQGLGTTLDLLQARASLLRPSRIVGIESRGFLFGAAVSAQEFTELLRRQSGDDVVSEDAA